MTALAPRLHRVGLEQILTACLTPSGVAAPYWLVRLFYPVDAS